MSSYRNRCAWISGVFFLFPRKLSVAGFSCHGCFYRPSHWFCDCDFPSCAAVDRTCSAPGCCCVVFTIYALYYSVLCVVCVLFPTMFSQAHIALKDGYNPLVTINTNIIQFTSDTSGLFCSTLGGLTGHLYFNTGETLVKLALVLLLHIPAVLSFFSFRWYICASLFLFLF